jgi:polyphenol oxidase
MDIILPQPDDGFAWVHAQTGSSLVCRALEPLAAHLFTTRQWRLGSTAAGDRDEGWPEVASAMSVGNDALVRVRQVHGAAVCRGSAAGRPEADIIVSDDPGAALAIQTADCVPLLIADTKSRACAAVHAGWRGMAARAPQRAVQALEKDFGCRPENLVAAIGPSIGACCYEVGEDVHAAFAAAGFSTDDRARWFAASPRPSERNPSMPGLKPRRPGYWFFDGWAAASAQLTAVGVSADRIYVAELCTASHPDALCSYRREGARSGRLAAAIRPRD